MSTVTGNLSFCNWQLRLYLMSELSWHLNCSSLTVSSSRVHKWNIGFDIWSLMPHSTIFQQYRGIPFYWWRTSEYLEKTTTWRKLLINFVAQCYIEYTSPWAGFDLTTIVMVDADRMSSCKTNYMYHIITSMTATILLWPRWPPIKLSTVMYLTLVALNTSNAFPTY